jgi:LysM repeat protein
MRRAVLALVVLIFGLAAESAAALPRHQVAGLQVALYRYGHYSGPIDGIAGPMTRRAIANVQRSLGVTPTGRAGKRVHAALGVYGRPLFGTRTLRRGMTGFDVSVLQFLLARHGFPTKNLNSTFDPLTERQVRKFQRSRRLAADGVVGRRTRAALLARSTKGTKTRRRPVLALHVVRPGETLTAIAEQHGTTVRTLAAHNRLSVTSFLLVGAKLKVPRRQELTRRESTRASFARWASRYGVDVRLVRALAWQESKFQTNVRSSAGAVGVMQVTPPTWSFVEMFVIGHSVPRTVDGNVRVGVAYLHHLLHEFNGNARRALGAYYQGPASVRRHGLFADTRRFVNNVFALRGRV